MDYDYSVEYSQTWSGGLQYQLLPSTMVEVSYMGTWTLGADNATVHNVPEPGPGPIQSRRPIPQLSRINSIRFDGKSIYHGVTLKAERRLARQLRLQRQLHAVAFEGRRVEPGRDRIGDEPPAERPAISSTRPVSGRCRASTTATSSSPAASTSCRSSRGRAAWPKRCSAAGATNAIFIAQSGAPFTVNLSVDRANIGAGPAQRPNQLARSEPARRAANAGPLVRHVGIRAAGAIHLRQRAAQQRRRSRLSRTSISRSPRRGGQLGLGARVPVGSVQPPQSGQLRPAEPHLREPRTSGESSAPRTRARCSSGCG